MSVARVLIVEDNPAIARTVQELLTLDGHEALIVTAPETAAATALDCRPDLILLDIIMPEVDGFEVARRLRQSTETAAVPIVVMTGRSAAALCAAEIGTPHYLPKPFEIETLLAVVRDVAALSTPT